MNNSLLKKITLSLFILCSFHATTAQRQMPPAPSIQDIEKSLPEFNPQYQIEVEAKPTEKEPPTEDTEDNSFRFYVKGYQLTGNTVFDDAILLALLNDIEGKEITLNALYQGANRITQYYQQKGFILAQSYLPEQEINDGIVTIGILEGHIDQVLFDNTSRLHQSVINHSLRDLDKGTRLNIKVLEEKLLLLSRIPGAKASSTLQTGGELGSINLLVHVTPTQLITGRIGIDNYGTESTGKYRGNANISLNNVTGLGDRLSLRYMLTDEEQKYYHATYQIPTGISSSQIGVTFSQLEYELGQDFKVLQANGISKVQSVFINQPIHLNRTQDINAQFQFDRKKLTDNMDLYGISEKKTVNLFSASLNAFAQDTFGGGGITSASLAYSLGDLTIHDKYKNRLDRLTANTQGNFTKLNLSLIRMQRLSDKWIFYGQLQGQLAGKNLDSSEKLSIGGIHGVRAYPQGEVSGDDGILANMEFRYTLSPYWQAKGFFDYGKVNINKETWSKSRNQVSLRGTGLGLSWSYSGWQVDALTAWKLGNRERSDGKKDPAFYFQMNKSF